MRLKTTAAWLFGGLLVFSSSVRAQEAAPSASNDLAEPHIVTGLASYWSLRFTEAERHFRAATEADPRSAAAHYYLGYSIYKIAEPKRPNDPGKQLAAAEFAKAYELDAGFRPTWRR